MSVSDHRVGPSVTPPKNFLSPRSVRRDIFLSSLLSGLSRLKSPVLTGGKTRRKTNELNLQIA